MLRPALPLLLRLLSPSDSQPGLQPEWVGACGEQEGPGRGGRCPGRGDDSCGGGGRGELGEEWGLEQAREGGRHGAWEPEGKPADGCFLIVVI